MKKSLFLIGHGLLQRLLAFIFLACTFLSVEAASIRVKDLRVEGLSGIPGMIGIGTASPRFSWKIVSDKNNIIQEAYQIIVASSEKNMEEGVGDLWDTGKILSNNQLWIQYQGSPLKSNQRAFVRVRVFTNKGVSDWSEGRMFCVGLLNESKWKGRWIGLESMDSDSRQGLHTRLAARYLRKEYRLRGPVKSATAYVAGLGLYDFYINGLIASFLKSKDDILRHLAHDFMNRRIWGYLNDTEENKEQIEAIKKTISPDQVRDLSNYWNVEEVLKEHM